MSKNSKNTFRIENNIICIMRDSWDYVAMATYREDYYDEIVSHVWNSDKHGYITNRILGGSLHRYMMRKWYGEDVLKDFTDSGYVVDHMNNNPADCRISNLEFLKHNRNVAKGNYFDKEVEDIKHELAVSITKDFKTKCYQIGIGCNVYMVSKDQYGKSHTINAIHLLYDCHYDLVILDAENIITQFQSERCFSLRNLCCCDVSIDEAPDIQLTEQEKHQVVVERNGTKYFVIGNGQTFIKQVHQIQDWKP